MKARLYRQMTATKTEGGPGPPPCVAEGLSSTLPLQGMIVGQEGELQSPVGRTHSDGSPQDMDCWAHSGQCPANACGTC